MKRNDKNDNKKKLKSSYEIVDARSIIAIEFDTDQAKNRSVRGGCIEVKIFSIGDAAQWQEISTPDSIAAREDCTKRGSNTVPGPVMFDLRALKLDTAAGLRVTITDSSNGQSMTTRLDPRRVGWYSTWSFPVLFVRPGAMESDQNATTYNPVNPPPEPDGSGPLGQESPPASVPAQDVADETTVWHWIPSVGVSYGMSYRPRSPDTQWGRLWSHVRPGVGFNTSVIGANPLASLLEAAGVNREIRDETRGLGMGLYVSLFDGALSVIAGREMANDKRDWYCGVGLSFVDKLQRWFTKDKSKE